ncbi:MAG TPA: acyl-CoA dehydrogenase family protein [Candidatus Lumbricidophila sp.]|nr:acyl-CoA dehydrogenase family protein [Candidatus Lumbricidophila sp.]
MTHATPASDPVDLLGFAEALLSPRELEAIAAIRAWGDREVTPIIADHWERAEFPMQVIAPLASLGTCSFAWPESAPFANSAVFRGFVALELARIDPSVSTFVGVQNGLVAGSLAIAASPAQRAEWLPKVARCDILGAFALTEPGSGSDAARGLTTTARRDGDRWVLNGQKRWIGNATFAEIAIVWAKDVSDGRVLGFIVPTATPGFSATKIERKISLRPVQNADITLTDVIVPDELRLGNATGFATTAAILRQTRAEVAWAAVGTAIGAYEAALSYTKARMQFGRPLAANQLVQSHLVNCLGNITASIGMLVRVSQLLDEGQQFDEHSALAKAYATARMRETVAWAREAMGGNGIVLDYAAARYFADAEALYSYEGTREVNTLIVGRAITGHSAFV